MSNVLEGSAVQQFEVAQGFMERCQARSSVQALAQAFQQATEALGFRHFVCCSHVDPLQPPRRAVTLHTYPKEWAPLFSELEFFDIDPVLLQAGRSVVPDCERLPSAAYLAVQLMAFYMYEAASTDAATSRTAPAAHCGGANRSSLPRTGIIFSYSLGWLKQYENAFLTYPPQVACEFSKAIRDLLGYRIHRPNLGGYEGQDPSVLFETRSHTLAAVDAIPPAVALELQAHYQNRAAGSQG